MLEETIEGSFKDGTSPLQNDAHVASNCGCVALDGEESHLSCDLYPIFLHVPLVPGSFRVATSS